MPKIIKYAPNQIIVPNRSIHTINNNINIKEDELNIYCPGGFGDCMWLLCKIYYNTNKKINLHSYSRHAYSTYLLKNLPKINEVTQSNPYRNYAQFVEKCKKEYINYNQLTDLNNINEMYIEMNNHVDSGNPINSYLPNLKTTYNLPWKETQKERVESIYKKDEYIVIYTSEIRNNNLNREHTGNWNFNKWHEIINKFKDKYKIVWVGAEYDRNALDNILKTFAIDYYVNEDVSFLLPLMRNAKATIQYQSGISCLCILENINTYMLYFNKLTKLPYMICSPEMINNKKYKPEHFNNYNINILNQWVEEL
jgi:hypothetical protein